MKLIWSVASVEIIKSDKKFDFSRPSIPCYSLQIFIFLI